MNKEILDKIVIALDVPTFMDVRTVIGHLQWLPIIPQYYKVGMQIISSSYCHDVLCYLEEEGFKVMLDLKLHDIPNTMKETLNNFNRYSNIEYFTIHFSVGPTILQEMLSVKGNMKMVAVSILTASKPEDEAIIYGTQSRIDTINYFGRMALELGIDGMVMSYKDYVDFNYKTCKLEVLTPGIRLHGDPAEHGTNIGTPFEAIHAGVSKIIIGREIVQSIDPGGAVSCIYDNIMGVK
jgi:orotidine-5'-phosphate decarboxylase